MSKTTSVQKLVKLLQDTQDLESELKSLYRDIQFQQEAKVTDSKLDDIEEKPKDNLILKLEDGRRGRLGNIKLG